MGAYILVSTLVLITCVLLVLIVLAQNAKGGGLSSTFGSTNNQVMGVKKTTDFLEKTTWTLAIVLLVLSLVSSYVIPRGGEQQQAQQSEIQGMIPAEDAGPIDFSSPAEAPAQQQPASEPVEVPAEEQQPIQITPEEPEE